MDTILLLAILTTTAADPTGNDHVVVTAVQPSPSHYSAAGDCSHQPSPITSLRSVGHTPSPIAVPEAQHSKEGTENARGDWEDVADLMEEDVIWTHKDPEGKPQDQLLEKVTSEWQTADLGKHDIPSLSPAHTDSCALKHHGQGGSDRDSWLQCFVRSFGRRVPT
jgi:hypothetical protein